jgi:STE24 endopeptidase
MGRIAAPRPALADGGGRRRDRAFLVLHLLALAVVFVGVSAQIVRPLAPDLGPPPDPSRWFDPEFLARARAYRQPLYAAGVVGLSIRLVVPCLAAFTAAGRRLTGAIVDRVGEERPAQAAAAVITGVVGVTDLAVLPVAFWAGYLHEGRWGFRTQGIGGWLYDWTVAIVPVWLAVAVVTLAAVWLARRLPRAWPAVAGIALAVVTAAMVYVAPLILEPLVFRMAPLPEGALRTEVERVLERADRQVDRILVADASRRTTKRNAYVSGLGRTRRVVLYDTLVEGQSPEEVGAVLAHELGHDRNGDIPRGILFAAAGSVILAYAVAFLVRRRVAEGRQAGQTDPRAAALVLAVVVLLNVASAPVQNFVSRRAEAAADLTALQITGQPEVQFAKFQELARANLANPAPPRWVYVLWSTHPTTAARLFMAEQWPDLPPGGRP